MSDEELQQKALEEQQKQEDAHDAGKTVLKDGAKVAGEVFAPGVGGAAVDAIASTKAGEKILDTGSEMINRVPGVSDVLSEAKPVIDKADQALNMASIANNPTGAAKGNAASAADAASNVGEASSAAKNAESASNIQGSRAKMDSEPVKIKSNMPVHGENLRQNGSSYETNDGEEENAEEDEAPDEEENEQETFPNVEEEPKKKKGIIRKTISFITLMPLICLGIPFVLILFFILFLFGDTSNLIGMGGLTYYDTACNEVTVIDSEHEGENGYSVNGTYDLDTYIAGVVVAEVGGFHNDEIFKAFAVAARTYALRHFENSETCTIAGNTTKQSFLSPELAESKGHNMDVVLDAVKSTMGIVVADKNGRLIGTEYDAFCMDHTDANYYYLRQQNQALDRTWVEERVPSAYRSGVCAGGHGRGMSQYGALYLAMQQGKSYQEILKYYYGDITFNTILKSSASTNYTIATSTGSNDQIHMPLQDFLASKGSNVASFNDQIMNAVKEAGPGTRDGVIAAATSLVGTLYEQYGGRLPYTYGGGHGMGIFNSNRQNIDRSTSTYYGADPLWGSPIYNARGGRFTAYINGSSVPYYYYGPDCSAFIGWALKNGGFNGRPATDQGHWGTRHYMDGTYKGQPGDLIWHTGHIMLIVGVDEDAQKYYIAHAAGGSEGVKINAVSFRWKDNYIVDMTNWYGSNVTTNDPVEYERLFQAGKLA